MDGMTVEVGDDKDYEPDALVNCGEPVANDSVAVPNPIVIVEVTSPSTEYVDTGSKLEDYFTLPSVQDYLLVSTKKRQIIHHSRLEPGKLLTRIFRRGPVELAPPGVSIQIAELYEGTDLV